MSQRDRALERLQEQNDESSSQPNNADVEFETWFAQNRRPESQTIAEVRHDIATMLQHDKDMQRLRNKPPLNHPLHAARLARPHPRQADKLDHAMFAQKGPDQWVRWKLRKLHKQQQQQHRVTPDGTTIMSKAEAGLGPGTAGRRPVVKLGEAGNVSQTQGRRSRPRSTAIFSEEGEEKEKEKEKEKIATIEGHYHHDVGWSSTTGAVEEEWAPSMAFGSAPRYDEAKEKEAKLAAWKEEKRRQAEEAAAEARAVAAEQRHARRVLNAYLAESGKDKVSEFKTTRRRQLAEGLATRTERTRHFNVAGGGTVTGKKKEGGGGGGGGYTSRVRRPETEVICQRELDATMVQLERVRFY